MLVSELMARLSELDPSDDIFFVDSQYGVTEVTQIQEERHHITTANGRELPKMVWCIAP